MTSQTLNLGREICQCERCNQFVPWLETCAECGRYVCGWCVMDHDRCICQDCVKEQEQEPEANPV